MPTLASDIPQIEVNNASTYDLSSQPPTQNKSLSLYPPRLSSTLTGVENGDEKSSLDRSLLNISPPFPAQTIHSSIHSGQSVHLTYGHSRRLSLAPGTSSINTPDNNHDPLLIQSNRHSGQSIPLDSECGHDKSSLNIYPPSTARSIHPTRHSRPSGPLSSDGHSSTPSFASVTPVQANHCDAPYREHLGHERSHDGSNQDENFDPRPFSFNRSKLERLDFKGMEDLGGTQALLKGLGTNGARGLGKEALSVDTYDLLRQARFRERIWENIKGWWQRAKKGTSTRHKIQGEGQPNALNASIDERRRVYGSNCLPTRRSKAIPFLMWSAFKDKVLVMLFITAVVSLALGLFHQLEPSGWVEGASIMVAIVIVVIVGSTNDWRQECQIQQLNDKREEHTVNVIRDGAVRRIDSQEVVVGDIALLTPGEVVPCDGVFLSGHVRCHETGPDGKPRKIRKANYEDVKSHMKNDHLPVHTDCFVSSGSKVLEGVGSYVVIVVGTKSFHGRTLQRDLETSPLQQKLNTLAEIIAKFGLSIGFILFSTLMIRFLVIIGRSNPVPTTIVKGIDVINIIIITITLIVVAVPRGLLLDVTFANRQMTDDKLLVHSFRAFESMEHVSVFCTTKTGVLTQNEMTVIAGSIGDHAKFEHSCQDLTRYNLREDSESSVNSLQGVSAQQTDPNGFSVSRDELIFVLPLALLNLLKESIELNSGALKDQKTGDLMCAEDQTEAALLHFAQGLGRGTSTTKQDAAQTVQTVPFSSSHKGRCVVVRLPDGTHRAYFRGASEILLRKSTRHVVVPLPASQGGLEEHAQVETRPIGTFEEFVNQTITSFDQTITSYAKKGYRTIALCYRDLEEWSPPDVMSEEENVVQYSNLAQDLTLIAIIAIEDKLRDGAKEMVKRCHDAGLTVKMVTGDNLHTACFFARQCGVSSQNGRSMEGFNFRKRTEQEQFDHAPGLEVLARSSPEDKKAFVQTLEKFGQVVSVTANGPVLKKAEFSLSMNITGTEVAKEVSHVTVLDDNFTSILKVITWSRCFNDSARKLLQFQISTIFTVVVITVVSTVASNNASSVLSAVQLLWIHLIMDPFAALALLTDRPPETLHNKQPYRKTRPLFTTDMYNQILIQSIYQIAFTLIFHFLGSRILGNELSGNAEDNDLVVKTLVFNAFVFAQIFNSINCRRLDKEFNIFEGLFKNRYILTIILIEVGVQTLIIFTGGDVFHVRKLTSRDRGISLALGIVPIPLGVLIRLLPNEPFEKVYKKLGLLDKSEDLPVVSSRYETRIDTVNRPGLKFFTMIHGGRERSSAIVTRCY